MIPQRLIQRLGGSARSAFSQHSKSKYAVAAGGALALTVGGQAAFADDDIFSDETTPPAPSFSEAQNVAGQFQLNISPGIMVSVQTQGEADGKGPGSFRQLGATTMLGIPNETGHVTEFSALVVDEGESIKMCRLSMTGSAEVNGNLTVGIAPRTDMKVNFALPGIPTGQPAKKNLSASVTYKADSFTCGASVKNTDVLQCSFTKNTSHATVSGTEIVINKDEGTNVTGLFRYKDPSPLASGGTFLAMLTTDYVLNMIYLKESRASLKGVKFELYGQKRDSAVTLLHKYMNQAIYYEWTIDTTGVIGSSVQLTKGAYQYSGCFYHPLGTPQFAYGCGVTINA